MTPFQYLFYKGLDISNEFFMLFFLLRFNVDIRVV